MKASKPPPPIRHSGAPAAVEYKRGRENRLLENVNAPAGMVLRRFGGGRANVSLQNLRQSVTTLVPTSNSITKRPSVGINRTDHTYHTPPATASRQAAGRQTPAARLKVQFFNSAPLEGGQTNRFSEFMKDDEDSAKVTPMTPPESPQLSQKTGWGKLWKRSKSSSSPTPRGGSRHVLEMAREPAWDTASSKSFDLTGKRRPARLGESYSGIEPQFRVSSPMMTARTASIMSRADMWLRNMSAQAQSPTFPSGM